jgi:serine/threonine protein kinase
VTHITLSSERLLASPSRQLAPPETVGKYALLGHLGKGGMGVVLLGRTRGAAGFSRLVAVKRLHPQFASDPGFVARFKDEVWVSGCVQHPNVVQTLDVLSSDGELFLVMEYIDGATLNALLEGAARQARCLPLDIVSAVISGCLHGLHAAHEATDEEGVPLRVVHRDVSPQNIMIGRDGQIKVLDFGLAQAAAQSHVSRVGFASGKAAYMAPEQVRCEGLDLRTDIFAVGVVLWEALTGQRLFRSAKAGEEAAIHNVLVMPVPPPSRLRAEIPSAVDALTLRALCRDPSVRFATAREFALSLEAALPPATASRVSDCLAELCSARLAERAALHLSVRRKLHPLVDDAVTELNLGEPETEVALPGLSTDAVHGRTRAGTERSSKALALLGALVVVAVGAAVHVRVASSSARESERGAAAQRPGVSVSIPRPTVALEAQQPAVSASPLPVAPIPSAANQGASATVRQLNAVASKVRRRPDPCSPPTFVDQDGIRHFKDGCL